jgi:hypothetical protein
VQVSVSSIALSEGEGRLSSIFHLPSDVVLGFGSCRAPSSVGGEPSEHAAASGRCSINAISYMNAL